MSQPPKNIPHEVNIKWLALRRKHQKDTADFQDRVTKDRAEFESRVERAKNGLLAKHINEERDFWSKAGQVSNSTSSANKTTPKPTGKSAAAGSGRQTATPGRTVESRIATAIEHPRPANAPQGAKPSQAPAAAPKPKKQRVQKKGPPEVIDLVSDDEEVHTPASKTPATTANVAPGTTRERPILQEYARQDSASPENSPNKPSFAIPSATLELFGSPSIKKVVPRAPMHIKDESDPISSSKPSAPTPRPSTPPLRQFHGLPVHIPSTPSTFAPRAFSATPQVGPSSKNAPLTPPSTPGSGAWSSARSDHMSPGFPPRAASMMPHSGQHYAPNTDFAFPSYQQPSKFGPSSTASPVPPSSSFTFQTHSTRFSSPLSRAAVPATRTSSPFGTQIFDRPGFPSHNFARRDFAQQKRNGESSSSISQGECGMTDAPAALSEPMTPATMGCSSAALQRDSTPNVNVAEPSHVHHTPQRQQLPSPPPSHASITSEPLTNNKPDISSSSPAFKKPSTPASAAPNQLGCEPATTEARHVRAGTTDSRASSITVQASRDQRGSSIASNASGTLLRPRKRKVEVSVSSDEEDDESDYAPSEPDSPLANKSTKWSRNEHAAKKTKTTTSSTSMSQHASTKAKNAFGFKAIRLQARAGSTAPNASTKKLVASTPTAPNKPSLPAPRSSPASTPKPTPHLVFTHPSKRRAAKDAELKTQKILEDLEEFNTECTIEEADQFEDARLPEDMQRMSITPAPPARRGEEAVQTATPAADPKNEKEEYTYHSWTRDRMAGDRVVNRSRAVDEDEDDDEIDMDEVEELDLTGEA